MENIVRDTLYEDEISSGIQQRTGDTLWMNITRAGGEHTLYEDEISSGIQEQEDGEHCKRYPI